MSRETPISGEMSFFSLRKMISGSFVALFLLSMLIGIFAMTRVGSINRAAQSVVGEIDAVANLGLMNEVSQELRALDVLAHAARGNDESRSYAAQLEKAQDVFSAAWSRYAPTVSGPEEQALAHRLRDAWQHFLALESEVSALDRAGEHALADTVIFGAFSADADAFRKAVRAVLAYRQARVAEETAATDAVGRTAMLSVAIALGVVAILTAVVSGFIIRRVATPIMTMTKVMRRLAERDADVTVPGGGRRDEIGAMAEGGPGLQGQRIDGEASESERDEVARRSAEREEAGDGRNSPSRFESSVRGIADVVSRRPRRCNRRRSRCPPPPIETRSPSAVGQRRQRNRQRTTSRPWRARRMNCPDRSPRSSAK